MFRVTIFDKYGVFVLLQMIATYGNNHITKEKLIILNK